jgi:hypothetical protein
MMRVFLLVALFLNLMLLFSFQATSLGDVESRLAAEAKKMKIEGKDWQNPTPDNPAVVKTGMEHFQHHCQIATVWTDTAPGFHSPAKCLRRCST